MVADTPPAVVAPAPARMRMPMPVARPRPWLPVLREGDPAPAAELVDQRGRRFGFAATGGRTTIVSFVYTRCRDVRTCPLVAAEFARMQRLVRGRAIRLVTLTVDPAYDSAPVLARYGSVFGADPAIWSLVGGAVPAVNDALGRFGILAERPQAGSVVHSDAAIVIDARGRIARIFDGATWAPEDVVASAREVAGETPSPLRMVRLWLTDGIGAICGGRGATPLTAAAGLGILAAVLGAFTVLFVRAFRKPQPSARH